MIPKSDNERSESKTPNSGGVEAMDMSFQSTMPLVNESCICLAMRRATRQVSRLYDESLAPYGLTIGQLGILGMITSRTNERGGPSVQELADAFDMDQSAMSRTLKPLLRDGLIIDGKPAEDRRRRTLALTSIGRDRMEAASKAWTDIQQHLLQTLGSTEFEQLLTLLERFGRTDFDGKGD
ncbi:MAG: MarR family winged helix-turn-helix transcriptional regulator [Sneathiella sp.]